MREPNIRIIKYNIPDEFDNRTLLDFLKSVGYSRNILTHLKETTNIDVYQLLHAGETVEIKIIESVSSENVVPIEMPLHILYEDSDMIVINKPSNMPTHPSKQNFENTLGNALAYYYKDMDFVYRPINRLDRDTTGVVIVAKNILSAAYLSNMVANNRIVKNYIGIVQGNIYEILLKTGFHPSGNLPKDLSHILNLTFDINLPIARENPNSVKRTVLLEKMGGERALTRVFALHYYNEKDLSLCKFRLYTGRTHQIRIHMQHIGFPIIGDFLYNPDYTFIKRQALHCSELVLTQPITGKMLRFVAPLPNDMRKVIIDKKQSKPQY